jgi:hypothetical protein
VEDSLAALGSVSLLPDSLICGDFNARLGDLTGDAITNTRGTQVKSWLVEHDLTCLNAELAYGVPTYHNYIPSADQVHQSIIDLFVTPSLSTFTSPSIVVESDLSLDSDHRLLSLSFSLDMDNLVSSGSSASGAGVLPSRRLWNLSRLGEPDVARLYVTQYARNSVSLRKDLDRLLLVDDLGAGAGEAIETLGNRLNACIYDALDSSLGVRRPRPSYWKKYWNSDLASAATFRDSCFKKWRHAIGFDKVICWNEYIAARIALRKMVQSAKRASWKSFCASLESNLPKAVSKIKSLKRRHQVSHTFGHADGPVAAVSSMASHLASTFSGSLLPSRRPPAFPSSPIGPYPLPDLANFDHVAIAEVILKSIPSRKAPGSDHLRAEMLRPIARPLSALLSVLFRLCYRWSYVPKSWRSATIFPIFKKGDPKLPSNFRPISLTSVFRKILEMCMADSLQEHSPAIDVAQGGFRSRRSPLDQAMVLHDLIGIYRRQHRAYPVVCFLDIKAAYDTVDRRVVWQSLARTGTPAGYLGLLAHLFEDVHVSVSIDNHSSTAFTPATGVLQGSVLSPQLYSIYINTLPELLRQVATASVSPTAAYVLPSGSPSRVYINSLLFADDVALIGSPADVQSMLDLATTHSMDLGYRWSPSKCAVLSAAPMSATGGVELDSPEVTLYGETLPVVDTFTYLGMPFNYQGLSASDMVSLRSPGALATMSVLNRVGVNRNGFSLLLCARLFTTFIRPKLEYGIAITQFNGQQLKSLESAQNKCLRRLVGGGPGTAVAVLRHILNLPSMTVRMQTCRVQYAVRFSSLPADCLLKLLSRRYPRARIHTLILANDCYQDAVAADIDLSKRSAVRAFFTDRVERKFTEERAVAIADPVSRSRHPVGRLHMVCRPRLELDPILYLPATRVDRSRLVRWRLNFLPGEPRACPCSGELQTRSHFDYCAAIPPGLFDRFPQVTTSGHCSIDAALNALPTSVSAPVPAFWSDLLTVLWYIECLCKPSAVFVADVDPGAAWRDAQSLHP